ncbi:MAG: hypothetical protein DSM106950_07780 [Stigonema ocellatum SAG 48.90 = DSM 106950]|nr:hypothetical protein [Stigonema ocellatum SAG 48.90 = DSM 106950]
MMIRSRVTWLIPVAFSLVGFGSTVQSATAQTTYPFEAPYDIVSEFEQITPDVSKVTTTGENADAPYGLTNFKTIDYAQFDPTTGITTAVPDAATFGLKGLPIGTTVFSGSGNDSLFGNSNATATNDIENLIVSASGSVNITGGSGRFSGATGTLTHLDTYPLNSDPTAPLTGRTLVSGSFETPQSVPEPTATTTLISIGIIGANFLVRQRRLQSTV